MGMTSSFIEAPEVEAFLNGMSLKCQAIPAEKLEVMDVVPVNFPVLLLILTALLLLGICVKRKPKVIEEQFYKREARLAVIFTLICAFYLMALSLCGFIVATIATVHINGALLCRWRFTLREGLSTVLLSLLLSFGCFYLFTTLFLMDLPPWPY